MSFKYQFHVSQTFYHNVSTVLDCFKQTHPNTETAIQVKDLRFCIQTLF